MGKEVQVTEESHKSLAKSLFNSVWELLDDPKRSQSEEINMVHMAHASRYHWGKVGGPVQFTRGEWQISRVYSVLKRGEPALFHAKESLRICEDNEIGDLDLAFVYEALARAYSVTGETILLDKYLSQAMEASESIENEDNKKYLLSELDTITE